MSHDVKESDVIRSIFSRASSLMLSILPSKFFATYSIDHGSIHPRRDDAPRVSSKMLSRRWSLREVKSPIISENVADAFIISEDVTDVKKSGN